MLSPNIRREALENASDWGLICIMGNFSAIAVFLNQQSCHCEKLELRLLICITPD